MKRQLCQQCGRPIAVCFCHCITLIKNDWPIWLFQHHKEKKHAIGTGKIVEMSLRNINCFDTKTIVKNSSQLEDIETTKPILVYPGDQSIDISTLIRQKPQPLLFLDGSWRKTRKMIYEHPILNELTRLSINPVSRSRYKIRKEPNDSAISTLEAIVFVLSELEGNTNKYQPMLDAMDWMINQQIN